MPSLVSQIPAAPADLLLEHLSRRFAFETDCWDVHESLRTGAQDFVLLDVRGPAAYAQAHVPGAISLPHGKITEARMTEWPKDTLFVVYCAGPHCNGADRAALRLAHLRRPVKVMAGGISGWVYEGFPSASGLAPGSLRPPAAQD